MMTARERLFAAADACRLSMEPHVLVQTLDLLEVLREYDEHQCEDIAAGALDAQADAERRMFAMRAEVERLTRAIVNGDATVCVLGSDFFDHGWARMETAVPRERYDRLVAVLAEVRAAYESIRRGCECTPESGCDAAIRHARIEAAFAKGDR